MKETATGLNNDAKEQNNGTAHAKYNLLSSLAVPSKQQRQVLIFQVNLCLRTSRISLSFDIKEITSFSSSDSLARTCGGAEAKKKNNKYLAYTPTQL